MENKFPPSPFDPFPDLPLWTEDISSGTYFYDDRGLDMASLSGGGSHADDDGPPSLPGGFGGTGGGSGPPTSYLPSYTISTNCSDWTNFFLVYSNTGTAILVGIATSVPGSYYDLQTNSDLSTTNWATYTNIRATLPTNWAEPVSFSVSSNLFFRAKLLWPTVLWVTQLFCLEDEWGNGVDASPALSLDGSTVYIATTGNLLYALDAACGTIIASNALGTASGSITSSPAIATNGDILIGSTDGFLYSFATNLNYNWSNNLYEVSGGGNITNASVFATPAVTAGGAVYIGATSLFGGGGFLSFDVNSNENWLFTPTSAATYDQNGNNKGFVDSSAAVGTDSTIYYLAEDWRLYAMYPDGNVKWYMPIPSGMHPDSSPGIAGDGSIVSGSDSPYLYSVNPDGSLKWFYHIPNTNDSAESIYSSPVIDSNGTVYIGAAQSAAENQTTGYNFGILGPDYPTGVYAISSNGDLLWPFTNISGWIVGACALGADGTVYAGAASSNHTFGMLYAISNGVPLWSFQTSNDIVSSPVICSDGGIIITCEDSNVYKLAGRTPLADAPWPMFHHDPQHTGSLAGTNSPGIGCEPPFPSDGLFGNLEVPGGGVGCSEPYFSFSVMGAPNTIWSVYASTNLLTTNWTNTSLPVTIDATGLATFTDCGAAANPSVFYYLTSNGCCSKVIGFVRFTLFTNASLFTNVMLPGTNLIADPFSQVDDNAMFVSYDDNFHVASPMNTVPCLFAGTNMLLNYFYSGLISVVPNDTTFANWTGDGFVTDTNNSNLDGFPQWLPKGDVTMLPGMGAMIELPTNAPNTASFFIGLVRESVTTQIHAGTNLLGSALPIAGGISSVLGYTNANAGDVLLLWDATNQVSFSYTNDGGTNWSPNEPYIGIAEGFFLISSNSHTWVQIFSPCSGD